MSAGQSSGTGAMTDLNDEKVRKDDILSNRDKAQRLPGQSLDGKGVQVDEYKDTQTSRRSASDPSADGSKRPPVEADNASSSSETDRPGFDLGGAIGETDAGKGLGLDTDAKEGRKDWGMPRKG